jgi:hypothetical protein
MTNKKKKNLKFSFPANENWLTYLKTQFLEFDIGVIFLKKCVSLLPTSDYLIYLL